MFRRLELLVDDEIQEIRKCRCGCGSEFLVNKSSKRIYYSRKHKEIAKNLRKKFRDAGVTLAPPVANS